MNGNARVVLLPGMDGTGSLFEPFLRARPPEIDAVVIAYPDDVGDVSVIVEHVLDRLPTDAPFVLVAESFSGPVALQVAARRPAGLRAVVLCATFVTSPLRWFPKALVPAVRGVLFRTTPSRAVDAALLGGNASAPLAATLRAALASVPPSVLAERARACLCTDEATALRSCPVPLVVIRATEDRVVPASCTREILSIRPDAGLHEIAGPHLVLQTKPVASWAAIAPLVAIAGA